MSIDIKGKEMELSELLFEKLGMEGCWHKWINIENHSVFLFKCQHCDTRVICPKPNTNLFTDSAFLTVFRAVKDDKDFMASFTVDWRYQALGWSLIDSPSFQLSVLTWHLEKDSEGERLREIMEVKDE